MQIDCKLSPEDLLGRDVDLPSAPTIFHKLNSLLANSSAQSDDFAKLVEQDPGLTARLLRIVNSPFFGLRQKIISTKHAVNLLGLNELRDLVIATTVIDRFKGFDNTLVSMPVFWRKSLKCGLIAKFLLPATNQGDAGESLFVAGLLHDIGHLLLYRQLPELMREAVLRQESTGQPLWRIERASIGFDYGALGGALLKSWSMPAVLVEIVTHHTDPGADSGNYPRETALVSLAARIAGMEVMNAENLDVLIPAGSPVWRLAGIQPAKLPDILETVSQRLEGAETLMA